MCLITTFLLKRVKNRNFISNISKQRVTDEHVRHALRANRTNRLNANRSFTEEQYDNVPGLLSQHIIRHGRAGLGKKYRAFNRKETRASEWQPTAYDSPCFSFFVLECWQLGTTCLRRYYKSPVGPAIPWDLLSRSLPRQRADATL